MSISLKTLLCRSMVAYHFSLFPSQGEFRRIHEPMQELERQALESMKNLLNGSFTLKPQELADLFYDCIEVELTFYK